MAADASSPPPSPEAKGRRASWRGILLVVSLALNLLVIGLVVGALIGKGPRGDAPALRNLGYGPFVSALPEDARREMDKVVRREQGDFRENRRQIREGFRQLMAILQAEELDEAALRAALQTQRTRVAERLQLGETLMVEQLVAMSRDERMAYAERLDKLLKRRGKPPKP